MQKKALETSYYNARTSTNPNPIPRTVRRHRIDTITSMPAGKMVPIAAMRLHQGDRLNATQVGVRIGMLETADILMNSVGVTVSAYLVPDLALPRFEGSYDMLLRSYAGEPPYEGGTPVGYLKHGDIGTIENGHIHYHLGAHVQDESDTSVSYIEVANLIWNFQARNRSKNIQVRDLLDTSVPPAFWNHRNFNNIVSDYDQALITGEVDLDVINSRMNVKGLGMAGSSSVATSVAVTETGGSATTNYAKAWRSNQDTPGNFLAQEDPDNAGYPLVYAELLGGDLSISLANIAAARRTENMAKVRRRYSGHEDDWVIDRLMDGLEIPDQAYKQPILLDRIWGPLRSMTRYSTTAGALDNKTTQGMGEFTVNLATPTVNTGGVVMIVAEILPDQVFERQKDYWLEARTVDDLPHALRDLLDAEPVTIVQNSHIDVAHSEPTDTFGYMPLNDQWNVGATRIGGRYFKGNTNDTYDQDREKLWTVDVVDPRLTTDWYIAEEMNQNPFIDSDEDPFDVQVKGMASITGLTQFGGRLLEADGEYEDVKALQDLSKNDESGIGSE